MDRLLGTIIGADANPVGGATVTVLRSDTGASASLWADDGVTTKSNPFTADDDGTWEFYAPNGRYDVRFAATGRTFIDDNSAGLICYDPADDAGAIRFHDDFLAPYLTGSDLLSDGHHWRVQTGLIRRVTGDATYQNGWIDVIEAGAAAGNMMLAEDQNGLALLWKPATDLMLVDLRIEKVGDAVNGTRRIGLCAPLAMANGDPTDGIYIRQIDANNAFLVCRATTETTRDLGQTLNNPTRVRLAITQSSVRAYVDGVAKTPVTTTIPTAILGFSVGGGATGSAAGLRMDYVDVMRGLRL
jgi:hypothetical protein